MSNGNICQNCVSKQYKANFACHIRPMKHSLHITINTETRHLISCKYNNKQKSSMYRRCAPITGILKVIITIYKSPRAYIW